jgi:pSer/pThr/pTyr-binding forkhead associated (FHA) protein
MLELEIAGQRFPVGSGDTVVGSDAGCGIRLTGHAIKPRHAIMSGAADGSVAVRPAAADAEVLVNGVHLGNEPSPLLHGDKLQLGSLEALCVDPRRSGSTQFVSAADVAKMAAAGVRPGGAAKPATPTAATGGRLVCLTDGREYSIGSAPLTFGREAGSDVVIPNKDVSRHHAEIMSTPQGYVMVDSSTNGTFVNRERIQGQRVLSRADVIRIGDHEFRFYADAVPAVAAPPAPAPTPPAPAAPAPSPAAPAAPSQFKTVPTPATPPPVIERPAGPPPMAARHRLTDTMHGTPMPGGLPPISPVTRTPAPVAPVLASMLVRSGSLKGTRYPIKVPVINIGRADFNDLVIADDSVSTSHAKLQRREEVWVLSDLGSTNGTFVDGERIEGETVLSPGATIRFGEVALLFEPAGGEADGAKGGGTKVLGALQVPPPASAAPRAAAPRKAAASGEGRRGLPGWAIVVLVLVAVAAVAAALFFRR